MTMGKKSDGVPELPPRSTSTYSRYDVSHQRFHYFALYNLVQSQNISFRGKCRSQRTHKKTKTKKKIVLMTCRRLVYHADGLFTSRKRRLYCTNGLYLEINYNGTVKGTMNEHSPLGMLTVYIKWYTMNIFPLFNWCSSNDHVQGKWPLRQTNHSVKQCKTFG